MRRVCYVSGTRADYGLMRATLAHIDADPILELSIVATGMHLEPAAGLTIDEIQRDGFKVLERIRSLEADDCGAAIARGIARSIEGIGRALKRHRPDIVLLLGDRGEMLAGAIAALHDGIAIVHIHGGERSGTFDEPVRHAISKLSHFHFVATEQSRARLVRMGESEERVHVTGAPGLVGLTASPREPRETLMRDTRLDPESPVALVLFHPVSLEEAKGGAAVDAIFEELAARKVQAMVVMPNLDAGNLFVRNAIAARSGNSGVYIATHLHRDIWVSWMAAADFMIGNSSAGIIEAATFGTPVVNIGSRQYLRERNHNVIDTATDGRAIGMAIDRVLAIGRLRPDNCYGDGQAHVHITRLLNDLDLTPDGLRKSNAY